MPSFPFRATVYTLIAAALGYAWFLALKDTTGFGVLVEGEATRNETVWMVFLILASIVSAWMTYPMLLYLRGWWFLATLWAQFALGIIVSCVCWDGYLAAQQGFFGSGLGLIVLSPFLIFYSPWVLVYAALYTLITMEAARWMHAAWPRREAAT